MPDPSAIAVAVRLRLFARPVPANFVDDAPGAPPRRSARATPAPRSPKASACRCRCARARSRTSSATATSRSASRSTSASGAATPAPPTSRAAALEQTVRAAYDIARFTAEDPAAGLPDADDLADARRAARDLDLFHPWAIDAEAAIELALRCEAAALAVDRAHHQLAKAPASRRSSRISTPATRAAFAAAMRARAIRSRWRRSLAAGKRRRHAARRLVHARCASPDELAAPEAVGRYAAERALSRLASRKITTCEVPVLFESPLAAGLLGAYVQATSGGALYRKSTLPARLPRQAGAARAHRRPRGSARAARQGQRAVRRRGRARRGRAHGRRCRRRRRATSCRPIRRASSACGPPATPAARTT